MKTLFKKISKTVYDELRKRYPRYIFTVDTTLCDEDVVIEIVVKRGSITDIRNTVENYFEEDKERIDDLVFGVFPAFFLKWEVVPKLVSAKVGDFVLIHNDRNTSEEDCEVGIVASEMEHNRNTFYGCRYILINIGDRSDRDSVFPLTLTEEDYGGYLRGFLRVLTPTEAGKYLKKKAQKLHDKEIVSVGEKLNRVNDSITSLIANDRFVVKNTKILLDNSGMSLHGICRMDHRFSMERRINRR